MIPDTNFSLPNKCLIACYNFFGGGHEQTILQADVLIQQQNMHINATSKQQYIILHLYVNFQAI